jgi:hypothetical protein
MVVNCDPWMLKWWASGKKVAFGAIEDGYVMWRWGGGVGACTP